MIRSMTSPSAVTKAILLAALAPLLAAPAADWPQWRYDAGRTAASPAGLADELNLLWEAHYTRREPVWDDPLNWDLMPYDKVFEPVVAGTTMFIGFNDADKVVALDTDTGREKWTFYTDGPVRLPVCVWQGKVYAASDDGHLYCLDARTGKLKWKVRGGPSDRRVLGNRRLISTWPARGGPVVDEGTVYFAASIWPFMGTFIYALNAETGDVVWLNDGEGARYMLQPHRSPAFAGIAPQGSLVVVGDRLLIPGGRSVPACFDRQTGQFLYYHLARNGKTGGSFVCGKGNIFFNHYRDQVTNLYTLSNGAGPTPRVGQHPVLTEKAVYLAGRSSGFSGYYPGNTIAAVDAEIVQTDPGAWKQGQTWEIAVDGSDDLIRAGDCLYAAGGYRITAIRAPEGEGTPEVVWTKDVADRVGRLLAADNKLFAVTLSGRILAFGPAQRKPVRTYHTPTMVDPPAEAAGKALSIVQCTGVSEGYALFFGAGDGRLLEALACNSKLHIIAVEPDRAKVDALRRRLDPSGLYGKRITVHHADPLSFECPPYMASLTVVTGLIATGPTPGGVFLRKIFASMRPYGGVAWMPVRPGDVSAFRTMVEACNLPGAKLLTQPPPAPAAAQGRRGRPKPPPPPKVMGSGYVLLVRAGPLPGSAPWTHQYGDIANTVKSDDALVKLPLGLLWFGGSSNLDVLPRHGHGPPEQVIDGRLFIEGIDCLSARDVYTGRVLWRIPLNPQDTFGVYYDETHKDTPTSTAYNQVHIPGANARGTNFVATGDRVYVAQGANCYVYGAATGSQLAELSLPAGKGGASPAWGFIGVHGDALIAGCGFAPSSSRVREEERGRYALARFDRIASRRLIAMDRMSGEVRWSITARHGFVHNSIIAGDGKVFCLDRVHPYIEKRMKRRGLFSPGRYRLLALDLKSGKIRWQKRSNVFGTWLSYSDEHRAVLQASRPSRDMLPEESVPRMAVHRADNGSLLWDREFAYGGPPILHGKSIITHGARHNLLTGDRVTTSNPITGRMVDWTFARQYGCNYTVASENLLTFRSAAAGYFDLTGGGTGNFGGFKSGCTSNLVAADGVLNVPDYTRTCSCSYQNQTSLALAHDPEVETWTFSAASLGGGPVRRVGVNLGAPGDRLEPGGTLWLDAPSVGGPSPNVPVEIEPEAAEYFRRHSSRVQGDGLKWVAASGVIGPAKVTVSLVPPTSIVVRACRVPPKVDGVIDDPCWAQADPIDFEGNRHRRVPQTEVKMLRDGQALYLSYRRKAPVRDGKPVPFVAKFTGPDSQCWRDDELELFITDAKREVALQFAISCAGGNFSGRNVLAKRGYSDLTWNGEWSYAVKKEASQWTAEATVPFSTLRAEAIGPSSLQLNLMSQNLSRVGPARISLVHPGPGGFGRCQNFLPLVEQPAVVPERTYAVRLYFAEPEECGPGDRAFGVAVQGKTVIPKLDVLKESGGRLRPLVREFSGIRASTALSVSFLPTVNSKPPVLSGIEILPDGW